MCSHIHLEMRLCFCPVSGRGLYQTHHGGSRHSHGSWAAAPGHGAEHRPSVSEPDHVVWQRGSRRCGGSGGDQQSDVQAVWPVSIHAFLPFSILQKIHGWFVCSFPSGVRLVVFLPLLFKLLWSLCLQTVCWINTEVTFYINDKKLFYIILWD